MRALLKAGKEAAEVVAQFGIPVAPVVLLERAVFHHSVGSGRTAQEAESESKAAADIALLWNCLCDQVNMPSHKQDDKKAR